VLLCEPTSTNAEPLIRALLAERQPGLGELWEQAAWGRATLGALIERPASAATATA
jgi:membrane protein